MSVRVTGAGVTELWAYARKASGSQSPSERSTASTTTSPSDPEEDPQPTELPHVPAEGRVIAKGPWRRASVSQLRVFWSDWAATPRPCRPRATGEGPASCYEADAGQ